MCLAVPMRVLRVAGGEATVAAGELMQRVLLDLLPDVREGDYVLVHAGFAIGRLDPDEAREALALHAELGLVSLGTGAAAGSDEARARGQAASPEARVDPPPADGEAPA